MFMDGDDQNQDTTADDTLGGGTGGSQPADAPAAPVVGESPAPDAPIEGGDEPAGDTPPATESTVDSAPAGDESNPTS